MGAGYGFGCEPPPGKYGKHGQDSLELRNGDRSDTGHLPSSFDNLYPD